LKRRAKPLAKPSRSCMSWRGIVRARAKTPKGMLVKARMAALDPTMVSTVDDLEHALEERLETGHIIGLSLILDVLNLHGSDA
jgi:ABC-type histidine transport system ATPase subunit